MASINPSSVFRDSQIAGNPIVWLVVTLLVVLVAYVWMEQVTEDIVPDAVKKLSPEAASKNLEAAESIFKQETMAITSESDKERAQEYLEAEAIEDTIEPLFQAAEQHMDLGQYVLPERDNAWYDYQQILTLQPDNTKAQSGQTRIRNLFIDNAEIALESNDYAEAENWLVQLDVVEPDGLIQEDLRRDIKMRIEQEARAKFAKQKEQGKMLKIENSLAQAHDEENKFPINYNKIKDLYNRVLELDSGNTRALEGLSTLVDGLLDQAEKLLRTNKLGQSRVFLQRATSIDPDNKRISSVQLALDTKLIQLEAQKKAKQAAESGESQISNSVESGQPTTQQPTGQDLATVESTQSPDATDSGDAIDQVIEELQDVIVIEEVTAEEIAQLKRNKSLEKGIQAYYSGNYNRSFELLYPLAERGYARAQFRIGVMYRYGRSVSKNSDLSEKWFTSALPAILNFAQKGVAWAQTDLGTAYELGFALKQDFERAAYWYQLAANQDYAGAQTNLGVLYANGEGVNYSRSKAVYWLKKAARQGDLVAIDNLKIMGVTL